MYFVGIDCSKYKHDCFIATETGTVIKDTFTFDNSGTGFTQFFSVLDELNCPKSQIKGTNLSYLTLLLSQDFASQRH